MLLSLARSLRLLRRHGSTPLAKHALAKFASSSDANLRLISSFIAAWPPTAGQQRPSSPGANGIAPTCAGGVRLLQKAGYNPTLVFLRTFRDGYRGRGRENGPQVVDVSLEVWQLLEEYDVRATIKSVFYVHIHTTQKTSKQVQLTLHGRKAAEVAAMLADPPRKIDVPEEVGFWLTTKGPNGLRVKDILKRTGALVKASHDYKSVLLVGPSGATLAAKNLIDGLYLKHRRISQAVFRWLMNPERGATRARSLDLEREFDTCIGMGNPSDNDNAGVVDLAVLGEREEDVDQVFAVIGGLYLKHRRISQAVFRWLTSTGRGATRARSLDLDREFDTCIHMGKPSDDDPASVVDLEVVGEREEDVDQVFAVTDTIVVERVNVTKLQFEFWFGHDGEEQRHRSHHKLEDATDTCIVGDAGCFHVIGRPEEVKEAVEHIRKKQHIKLRTAPAAEISLATGNYIGRIRHKLENDDDLQIHLRYVGMRPGTCELPHLHRVDSEQDDAKADEADRKSMQAIDLNEAVLNVYKTWAKFLCDRREQIEASEGVGIDVSKWVNKRVLVVIAGSQITVKRGTEAVIQLITSDPRYRYGDIRLRRIVGQCVDTEGFEQVGPVGEEDLSNCEAPFVWER